MEKAVPMSWLNQILILNFLAASLCLAIEGWFSPFSIPIYIPITWAVFVTILSTWLSCHLLRYTLKAKAPISIEPFSTWLRDWMKGYLRIDQNSEYLKSKAADCNDSLGRIEESAKTNVKDENKTMNHKTLTIQTLNKSSEMLRNSDGGAPKISVEKMDVGKIVQEIDSRFIQIWYNNISSDRMFPDEAKHLLTKLVKRLNCQVVDMDNIGLAERLANVFLLHIKEYRRALRRVEKGTAKDIDEAYRCTHPGSRSITALEHGLHRLVTILAREFLQWELTSSLPCKLLLSILSKKLLLIIQTSSSPYWLFEKLLALMTSAPDGNIDSKSSSNGVVSLALGDGIASATAAVIPRSLPKPGPTPNSSTECKTETKIAENASERRSSLSLEGLAIDHRGLWGDVSILEPDSEPDEDRLSPVYEEPTDFATTIARLRSLLQQKSTATTPLQVEEKSCAVYEGCQFTNLVIPWTEFYMAPDGSQQLLYCIQFDDVEQNGTDLFETTTATVRRQHSDFAQLHTSLEEVPSLAAIMSETTLPEGGRVEMENYLKTLCTRLGSDTPPQLRHFLRPSSGAGKKADAVAPRLDRFLAKTVSGVFNTLKTVVPGFEMDPEEEVMPLPTLMPLADIPWRFIEDIKSRSLASELQQLVAERIDYCSVDTAYEAVDSVEGSGDSELLAHWWEAVNITYDEELEELDSDLRLTQVTIDLVCEILAGTGSSNALQQEAVVRLAKLLVGNIIESSIQNAILKLSDRVVNLPLVSNTQSEVSEDVTELKGKLLRQLITRVPSNIRLFLGDVETEEALNFLLDSLATQKVNQDLILQLLDVLASQLLAACRTSHDNIRLCPE